MLLRDFLDTLEQLYIEEMKDVEVMGEPEIMIDAFEKIGDTHTFKYCGYDNRKIDVERSDDGVYLIINRFKRK